MSNYLLNVNLIVKGNFICNGTMYLVENKSTWDNLIKNNYPLLSEDDKEIVIESDYTIDGNIYIPEFKDSNVTVTIYGTVTTVGNCVL